MPFNISNFRSNGLPLGGARPTQFDVVISLPTGLSSVTTSEKISFSCRATSLPASIIGVVEVPYFGRKIKLNGDREFRDWEVTIMNDEDFQIKEVMEKWSNIINTHISNRLSPDYKRTVPQATAKSYKAIAEVRQYGKTGDLLRSYKFDGIFPSVVSEIGVDWDAVNQYESFSVTFAYDWWVPIAAGGVLGADTFGILADDK